MAHVLRSFPGRAAAHLCACWVKLTTLLQEHVNSFLMSASISEKTWETEWNSDVL